MSDPRQAPAPHWRSWRGRVRRPAGLAPGTLIVPAEAPGLTLDAMCFGPEHLEEHTALALDEIVPLIGRAALTWIDVTGFGAAEQWQALGEIFDLHALALEDIAHLGQRPKIEEYGEDLLIFTRMTDEVISFDAPPSSEQVCLLVRSGLVVTFQERRGDAFEPVRNRIRAGGVRLRSRGADYLAYALLDALVDRFALLLDDYEEAMEEVETVLLESPSDVDLERLHRIRRDLISLRRTVVPLREVISRLMREDDESLDGLVKPDTRLFLRDCHDHTVRAIEQIDAGRELANSLMEVYLSTISHRTNEAMKTLTIIATLFIPLSFIVGLYGMNFDSDSPWNMPELHWRYGYPFVLAVMLTVVIGLCLFLRRRGWF